MMKAPMSPRRLSLERWNACGDCRYNDEVPILNGQYFVMASADCVDGAGNGGCRRGVRQASEPTGKLNLQSPMFHTKYTHRRMDHLHGFRAPSLKN